VSVTEHTLDKHILIVEDSPDLQMLLSQVFGLEGYPVSQAFNGKHALDLLHSSKSLPSLILLDIMMPVMDGFEFRNEQEKDPRLAGIPIVVMTADIDSQAKANKLGAVGVIRKPMLDIDALLGIAARYCSH
jgi:CheY-like chemotaxis protein